MKSNGVSRDQAVPFFRVEADGSGFAFQQKRPLDQIAVGRQQVQRLRLAHYLELVLDAERAVVLSGDIEQLFNVPDDAQHFLQLRLAWRRFADGHQDIIRPLGVQILLRLPASTALGILVHFKFHGIRVVCKIESARRRY